MVNNASSSAATEWKTHWTLVATGAAGLSLASMLTSVFGVMMAPIEQDFGWSRTQISSGPALVSITGMFLATAAGFAIDRLGARRIGILVALTMCSAIGLMSTVSNHIWHWWALWALFGLAAAANPAVWLTPISSLFTAGRGLAISVTLSGTGISASLAPIVAYYLVESYGWRAGFFGLAAIWGAITLPLVFLFFHGANERLPRAVADVVTEPQAELPGLTAREGFSSLTFYKILLATFISSVAGIALVLNLVPVLVFTGLTRVEAAAIAGALGIASITGRIVGGYAMDRWNARPIATITTFGAVVLPLALLFVPGSVSVALATVVTYGLFSGARYPCIVYLTSRYVGARAFGALYGTVSMTIAIALGVGPLAANYVYDVLRTYNPVMWAAIPAYLLAGLLFASLGRYPDFLAQTTQTSAR